MPQARGKCSVCEKRVDLRSNGTVGAHPWKAISPNRCAGVGKPPKEAAHA